MRAAEALADALAASDFYREALRLVVYAPLRGELPVQPVWERARAEGRALLWPRQREDGALDVVPCEGPDALTIGPHGVREPPRGRPAATLEPLDLILIPGLAFDPSGVRLGRGGGAWDRTLARHPAARSVGIGYEFQVVTRLPREAHDRVLAALCTERGFRRSQST